MKLNIAGYKCGMSRMFIDELSSVPVTLIYVPHNYITQIKTKEKDGYEAVQLSCGNTKAKHLNLPLLGHLKKSKILAKTLHEFRGTSDRAVGEFYSLLDLQGCTHVDVQAVSKGKGFCGVVRRWGFSTQDATHGNSKSHRTHGSTGACQDPGRVIKGKKMAGHLGNVTKTVQSLQIIEINTDENVLVVKGGIPGPKGATVKIKPAIKKPTK